MPHSKRMVGWCLKKAERELSERGTHRGLVRIKPDPYLINNHIMKAEHNLKAVMDFKRIGYSDWSASAAFYSIYHCFLSILVKHGYESRNQECTFAMIYELIESGRIKMDKNMIQEIFSLNPEKSHENPTITEIREIEQYGVRTSLENNFFERILKLNMNILEKTKEILEN